MFVPDAARARRLNRAVHADLADSLEHVAEAAADALPDVHRIDAVLDALHDGVDYPPALFSLYYDAVGALMAGDGERASSAFEQLLLVKPRSACRFVPLEASDRPDAYRCALLVDSELELDLQSPPWTCSIALRFAAKGRSPFWRTRRRRCGARSTR